MDKEILKAELSANIEANKDRLLELMKAYDLACVGYDTQEATRKDVERSILSENVFLSEHVSEKYGLKKGDRITGDKPAVFMSSEDYRRFYKIRLERLYQLGLTDKEGRYKVKWSELIYKAREELVNFILDYILPSELSETLRGVKESAALKTCLISVFKNNLGMYTKNEL